MENTSKNKWQVRLAAVTLFALGVIAGALIVNLYYSRFSPASNRRPEARFFRVEDMKEQLHLTPEQATEVEKIFADTRAQLQELRKQSEPKFGEIRKQTDERLQQVLTPEQWQQFQSLKNEMRERHGGRWRDKRGSDKEP